MSLLAPRLCQLGQTSVYICASLSPASSPLNMMLLDVFSADVHIAFLYVSDMQSRCGSSSLVCSEPRCHVKIIGRTQSTSPESRLHTAGSEPPSPHHPMIRRVYTGPGSLLGGHVCVCVRLITSAARLHDPACQRGFTDWRCARPQAD